MPPAFEPPREELTVATPTRTPRPRFRRRNPSTPEAAELCRNHKLVSVEIRLDPRIVVWLERCAAEGGTSPSAVVNRWLTRRIQRLERYHIRPAWSCRAGRSFMPKKRNQKGAKRGRPPLAYKRASLRGLRIHSAELRRQLKQGVVSDAAWQFHQLLVATSHIDHQSESALTEGQNRNPASNAPTFGVSASNGEWTSLPILLARRMIRAFRDKDGDLLREVAGLLEKTPGDLLLLTLVDYIPLFARVGETFQQTAARVPEEKIQMMLKERGVDVSWVTVRKALGELGVKRVRGRPRK